MGWYNSINFSGGAHGGNYKVRAAWFQGIVATVEELQRQNFLQLEKNQEEKINKFIEYYTEGPYQDQDLTTEEDIRRGDEILDMILSK